MKTLADIYRELRRPVFPESYPGRAWVMPAGSALHQARLRLADNHTESAWESMGGETVAEYEARETWEPGDSRVRIVESPDSFFSYEDLAGDCYEPDVNPEINANILKRQERDFRDLIESEGVWFYESQFWNGSAWEHADSVGGFVGFDGFAESGYAPQLMQEAMDKADAIAEAEAEALESERTDLYGVVA